MFSYKRPQLSQGVHTICVLSARLELKWFQLQFAQHCNIFTSDQWLCSASEKVLNWGLGPHEDQTAELVLILHKRPHLPQMWYIMGFESVFLYHKWRNIEISNSILLYMHLLGNGMYNKSYHNEHMSFCHKMCNVVNTRFFMTISHFNENNDLGSSKALKWVLIRSSSFLKGLFLPL